MRNTAPISRRSGSLREMAARIGTAKTMPVMMIGWTSEIGPLITASAWVMNPAMPSAWPSTQTGRCVRCHRRCHSPPTESGAAPAAWCCTDVDRAVKNALVRAKTIASQITASL